MSHGPPETAQPMSLNDALRCLAECHTRDDARAGFVVMSTADRFSGWSEREYIEAWRAVRVHLREPTEPTR